MLEIYLSIKKIIKISKNDKEYYSKRFRIHL
jgi:hypothetical protein